MILRNIDLPSDLIKELPENHEKIIKYLHSNLVNLDLNLQNLQSQVKQIKKSDPSESQNLSSLFKKSETNFERLLSINKSKIMSKVDSIDENIQQIQENFSSEFEKLHKRLETIEKDKTILTLFFKLKEDIVNDYVKPFQFELKENYKSIHLIEQSIKVQAWNNEATYKEFNSRFDSYKDKMSKVEDTVADFMKKADDIVFSIVNPVKQEVQQCQGTVENLYKKFKDEANDVLKDLSEKDFERQKIFDDNSQVVFNHRMELDKLLKGFHNTRNIFIQDFNQSTQKMFSDFSTFKSEVKSMFFDTFDNIKSDISAIYKKELQVIQDKLKWLPHDTDDMENMTHLEARLYTIETRIRAEESNRINQVNNLFQGTS